MGSARGWCAARPGASLGERISSESARLQQLTHAYRLNAQSASPPAVFARQGALARPTAACAGALRSVSSRLTALHARTMHARGAALAAARSAGSRCLRAPAQRRQSATRLLYAVRSTRIEAGVVTPASHGSRAPSARRSRRVAGLPQRCVAHSGAAAQLASPARLGGSFSGAIPRKKLPLCALRRAGSARAALRCAGGDALRAEPVAARRFAPLAPLPPRLRVRPRQRVLSSLQPQGAARCALAAAARPARWLRRLRSAALGCASDAFQQGARRRLHHRRRERLSSAGSPLLFLALWPSRPSLLFQALPSLQPATTGKYLLDTYTLPTDTFWTPTRAPYLFTRASHLFTRFFTRAVPRPRRRRRQGVLQRAQLGQRGPARAVLMPRRLSFVMPPRLRAHSCLRLCCVQPGSASSKHARRERSKSSR
jgi:hypothetical protein